MLPKIRCKNVNTKEKTPPPLDRQSGFVKLAPFPPFPDVDPDLPGVRGGDGGGVRRGAVPDEAAQEEEAEEGAGGEGLGHAGGWCRYFT